MDWDNIPLQFSLSFLFLSRTIIRTWNRKLFTVLQMRIRLTRLEFSLTELTHHFSQGQESLTCPAMCLLSILTTSFSLFLSPERHILEDKLPEGTGDSLSSVCCTHCVTPATPSPLQRRINLRTNIK